MALIWEVKKNVKYFLCKKLIEKNKDLNLKKLNINYFLKSLKYLKSFKKI